MSNVDI